MARIPPDELARLKQEISITMLTAWLEPTRQDSGEVEVEDESHLERKS